MSCPHCGRSRAPTNVTCTRSACQEAEYHACLERSASKRARKRKVKS
jgi:hypothetical protein